MQNISEWMREVEQDELLHLADELHIDCAYCYALEHGECERLPESVCSVHMAWLERKAQSLLVEPKKKENV